MRKFSSCTTFVFVLLSSWSAHAADAQSILDKARELQLERWKGISNYTVDQVVAGSPITLYYERVNETSFRVVPQFELQQRRATGQGMPAMTPERLAALSEQTDDGSIVDFDEMQELAAKATLVGKEDINGRSAFHLKADDVDHVERMDEQQVSFDTFEIWLDTKEYVPLKFRINGTATGPEGARPVVLEKVDSDYRDVPGSNLHEPYHQVMTMSGVIDEAQQKELQEAQKQMAEFEQQMAAMPAAQREMMERMMGPKIEMMKKMASGGGMEIVTEIVNIRVNTGGE